MFRVMNVIGINGRWKTEPEFIKFMRRHITTSQHFCHLAFTVLIPSIAGRTVETPQQRNHDIHCLMFLLLPHLCQCPLIEHLWRCYRIESQNKLAEFDWLCYFQLWDGFSSFATAMFNLTTALFNERSFSKRISYNPYLQKKHHSIGYL